MNGAAAIVDVLKKEGTEFLVCFPANPLIEAAAAADLRVITCRTERTAVNLADGYSRVHNGRRIGVCVFQNGPGIQNAYVGVVQAHADSCPILVMPYGASPSRSQLPAEWDPLPNYRGITKWAASIPLGSRIAEMMGRAYSKMRNGRRGPVLLELPIDVCDAEAGDPAKAYLMGTTYRTAGDPADVAKAAEMLLAAQHPVLYAGQGVLWSGASDELAELAELAGVPVMTTLMGKSAIPEDHPLALGAATGSSATGMVDTFLRRSDLVFCIGASLHGTLATVPIPAGKTLVHCTIDHEDLQAEYRSAHAVIGDAKLVLRQLTEEVRGRLKGRKRAEGLAREIAAMREEWLSHWMPLLTSSDTPINPNRLIWDINNTVDRKNAIITADSGSPRNQMCAFYGATEPRSVLGWGNSHQLGSSLGLALGAKLAAPQKLCIAYLGDAAFGMCGTDLETAVRERIAVLVVLLNNSWMGGYQATLPLATDKYKVGNMHGDYTAIARAMGCHAERVERAADIVPALKRAIAETAEGRPALLEVMTASGSKRSAFGSTTPDAARGGNWRGPQRNQ